MTDRTTRALDVLTDLSLTQYEALTRFSKLSRRWKPVSVCFVLHIGGMIRAFKAHRAFEECELARWADDGGMQKRDPIRARPDHTISNRERPMRSRGRWGPQGGRGVLRGSA